MYVGSCGIFTISSSIVFGTEFHDGGLTLWVNILSSGDWLLSAKGWCILLPVLGACFLKTFPTRDIDGDGNVHPGRSHRRALVTF